MTKWAVPAEIYDVGAFRIDPLMLAMVGQTPFAARLSQHQLVQLGRRTLEIAILRAIGDPIDLTAVRKDWQHVFRLAESASSQLNALIKNLAPPLKHPDWNEPQALARPLRSMIAGNKARSADALASIHEIERQAKEQAEALLAARAALSSIAANAKVKDRFVAAQNKNMGAQDQNEFVKTFGETWTSITGTLPTTRKTDGFLNLLLAAWADAKQGNADFRRSVGRACSEIKATVPSLVASGPDWF